MSEFFMVLIDGTGPYDDQQYKRWFNQSFLKQIADQLGKDRCKYYEGPGSFGMTTKRRSCLALREIVSRWRQNKWLKIFLAGYSRGGLAAIECSKMLGNAFELKDFTRVSYIAEAPSRGPFITDARRRVKPQVDVPIVNRGVDVELIPVEAMFLLDPVDRDLICTGGGIRSNVKRVHYVLRDRTIWEYSPKIKVGEYESPLDKVSAVGFNATGYNDPDRYARKWMKNADMSLAPGNITTTVCEAGKAGVVTGASHGAIGGLPWFERHEDEGPTKETANIINNWMAAYGVNVTVNGDLYTEDKKRENPRVTQAMVIKENEQKRRIEQLFNRHRYR